MKVTRVNLDVLTTNRITAAEAQSVKAFPSQAEVWFSYPSRERPKL